MTNTDPYASDYFAEMPPLVRLERALEALADVDLVELTEEQLLDHFAEHSRLEEELEAAWQVLLDSARTRRAA